MLGPEPAKVKCNSCGAMVITYVMYRPTMFTHVMALFLAIVW